jgi:hypothetical protein
MELMDKRDKERDEKYNALVSSFIGTMEGTVKKISSLLSKEDEIKKNDSVNQ